MNIFNQCAECAQRARAGRVSICDACAANRRFMIPNILGRGSVSIPDGPSASQPIRKWSKTVHLRSGGAVKVRASLDIFQLTPADRDFVFGIIDMLSKYESEGTTPK